MSTSTTTAVRRPRLIAFVAIAALIVLTISSCAAGQWTGKGFKEAFQGLPVTIRTFDTNSQLIDTIQGESVNMERDTRFDSSLDNKDSSVLRITIGGKEINHVGSSLILAEDDLTDIFTEFQQKNDISNLDPSTPILNTMYNQFQNDFTGKSRVLLIRSQLGFPLATYAGNKVSIFATDIPKTTGFLIDGKKLVVYRSDYTVYETALLENQN